jgi:osmotically-inducible protein OsmY
MTESERDIVGAIRAGFTNDARIPHPAEIAISEQGGAITLRGTVGTIAERRAAVDVAKSIPGVRLVEDDLSVDLRDNWNDNEIKGAVLQALMSSPGVPADVIDVSVSAGWVTLKGTVKKQSDSDAAFKAAAELPGHGGLTNKIEVVSPSGH